MTIKILGISGSPTKGGNVEVLLEESLKAVANEDGVETEFLTLADKKFEDCIQCNWCLRKQTAERPCNRDDDMKEIYPKLLEADGLLIATPVYVARLSGRLACFLDRLRCLTHSKVYRHALENKVGGAIAVSWFRNAGVETALLSIMYFYFVHGIVPIGPELGHGCQWGVPGHSSYGGTGKFDSNDRHGILKDSYALDSARSLSKRVVRMCRIMRSGTALEINQATGEKRV